MNEQGKRERLMRTEDALLQDRYGADDWRAALKAVDAEFAIEQIPVGFGMFVELVPDARDEHGGLRLHVPRLGSELGYDGGDEDDWDERIRGVIAAAARALGMSGRRPLRTVGMRRVDAWLDSIGRAEDKPLTKRERRICTTLVYGLAAAGWLVEGPSTMGDGE